MSASLPLRALADRPLILDVDGTLSLAESEQWNHVQPLPGAVDLLEALRRRRQPFLLLTNGSARTPEGYAGQLRAGGLPVEGHQVLTPAVVAATLLAQRYPGQPVLALGGPGLLEPLRAQGVPLADLSQAETVPVVLVGWTACLTYEQVAAASRALWAGAQLWTTVTARALAAHGGRAPAMAGAVAAALAHVTGAQPQVVGKPSPHALAVAAQRLGVPVERLVMVGDDLEVDVNMARAAGCPAVLVLTGTTRSAPPGSADLVVEGVDRLLPCLEP